MAKKPHGLMLAIGLPREGLGGPSKASDHDYGAGPPDGGPSGDGMGGEDKGMDNSSEDCVPVDCLAMPDSDQGDKMADPEPGDMVTYTVEGKVTRVEDGKAYIDREMINGKPCEEPGSGDGSASPTGEGGDDGAALESQARGMSGMNG
jgi:hypothetical protein